MINNIIQSKILLQIHSKTSLNVFESIIIELNKLELNDEQIKLEANKILSLYENGIKNLNIKQFQKLLLLTKKSKATKYDFESKLAFYEVNPIYINNILDFLEIYRKTKGLNLKSVVKNGIVKSRRYNKYNVDILFSTYENNTKHGIEHIYYYFDNFSSCKNKEERREIERYSWDYVEQKKYYHGKLISKMKFNRSSNEHNLEYYEEFNVEGETIIKIEVLNKYYGFNLNSENNNYTIHRDYLIDELITDDDYSLLLCEEFANGKLNGYSRIYFCAGYEFNYFESKELYDLENHIDKTAILLEHHFKNNKLHGKQICYYGYENIEQGILDISKQKMYELNFIDGLLDGKQFFYFNSGEIKLELNYSNGNLINHN